MREAYRLNQCILTDCVDVHFLLAYVYVGSSKSCDFFVLQEKIVASLRQLCKISMQDERDSPQI